MSTQATVAGEPLAETVRASKRYGTTLALDEVSMRVFPGRSVALAGRNGAGKSTLVRLLTGLDRPDSGDVRFGGAAAPDIAARALWRARVACVYQRSTILPDLTVGENLFLNDQPRSIYGRIRWNDLRKQGRAVLDSWALDLDVDARAEDIGVGKVQLLEIARALRQGSQLIILDEPTARLEAREIRQLFDHMNRLKATGVTFLFISHHLQEIYDICDRVAVMRDGRLVAEAAVGDMSRDDLVAAMVGEAYVPPVPSLSRPQVGALPDDGAVVLEVDRVSVGGWVFAATFAIRASEKVGLAGLAGSGKSELAQAIVGLRGFEAGRILFKGRELRPGRADEARDLGIGYVPEDRHLNGFCGNLSVAENMTLPVLHRIGCWGFASPGLLRGRAQTLIERLDIKVSSPDQNTSELSGGNQQKTVMARALSIDPEMLVLVCPTAGVDVASKQTLFGNILAMNAAMLLVSDEIDELALCDRVLVIFAGRIVREFKGAWTEQEMVTAIEGLGR